MAEFTIVTRSSSSAWIPELSPLPALKSLKPTLTSSPPRSATATLRVPTPEHVAVFRMVQHARPATHDCDRSTWPPGLRTFRGPNRPSSKLAVVRTTTISWSFGNHTIEPDTPFAVQSTWSKKAKRPSGAEKTPKRSWSRFLRIRCPAYETWR